MKKIIITFFVLCNGFIAFSQDCLDKVAKQAVEIDNLKKEKESLQDKNSNMTDELNKKSKKLQSQIKELQKENDKLEKRLDKKNIKNLETQLQQKIDLINQLNSTIDVKKKEITEVKGNIAQIEKQKYADGQQNIYDQIIIIYNKPFDELIKSSTKFSVERDLQIVGNCETVKKNLQDLQKYFAAQQILAQRYNESEVRNAQAQIGKSIPQSECVKNLNDKLGKYKSCNEALKTTIGKILELDKKFVADDDYSQEMKLRDILFELSWYFRNYRFNFTDYPYLSDIILEIVKRKQKDADADISSFLNQL